MIDLATIAYAARNSIFWATPYRTGNLARNGITDLMSFGGYTYGFMLFPRIGTNYGRILNEARVINYKVRNRSTGQLRVVAHNNRHYMWVDNFAEQFANDIPLNFPGIRRIA